MFGLVEFGEGGGSGTFVILAMKENLIPDWMLNMHFIRCILIVFSFLLSSLPCRAKHPSLIISYLWNWICNVLCAVYIMLLHMSFVHISSAFFNGMGMYTRDNDVSCYGVISVKNVMKIFLLSI